MCNRIVEQMQVNIHNCFCGLYCNEAIGFRQFCRGPCVCVLLPMPVNQRNDFMGIAKHIGRSSAPTCYGNCAIAGTFTGCCEIQSRTKYQGKTDSIYITFTVISVYWWNQLPTHHPVQFFLYLQMCWYQTNGDEDERCLKEGGNERQMRRCVHVKKRQKKRKHVSVRLAFPSTSLFIILCLLRLFKGALLLCHFLAGTSFFFSRCLSLWPRQEGWWATTPLPPAELVFITLYTLNIAHSVRAGQRERASTNDLVCACMFLLAELLS